MRKRLVPALTAYAVLGVIAFFVLTGAAREVVLILFGALALRTLIAYKAGWYSRIETPPPDSDSEVEQTPGPEL
jgi:hypothetical protein